MIPAGGSVQRRGELYRVLVIDSPSVPFDCRPEDAVRAGIDVLRHDTALSALLAVGTQQPSLVVAPTDMIGVEIGQFVEVVRTLTAVPVVVGLVRGDASSSAGFHALELGARSLIGLPCTAEQLAARAREVGAESRRFPAPLVSGPITLDRAAFRVLVNDQPIHFSPREVLFLEYLMLEAPRTVAVHEMAGRFAGGEEPQLGAALKMVARVRRKLNAAQPGLIQTVQGVGYRIGDPTREATISKSARLARRTEVGTTSD